MKERKITFSERVYQIPCKNYQEAAAAMDDMIQNILADNGLEKDWKGKKVVIKPNLLARRKPEFGVTTQPILIEKAAAYFVQRGAKVTIADSPGGMYSSGILTRIYETTGMKAAAENSGASLNFSVKTAKCDKFTVIAPLAEADLIVNVGRMKTHMLCDMTAAVKNLFGSIPGLQKAECHAHYPQKKDFCAMLVDLCLANAPMVNIIDGVIAMEGNGPAAGTLRHVGVLLGSANPFSLDLLCAHLMGFEPEEVLTVDTAVKRGLCPATVKELTVIGSDPAKYRKKFKRPKTGKSAQLIRALPASIVARLKREKQPVILTKKCIGCGECARCCPVETIRIEDKKAVIYHDKCIKCYCCHELCPQKAVAVKMV